MAALTSCAFLGGSDSTRVDIDAASPVVVRVIAYQGFSSMGLVDFMSKASDGAYHNKFRCVTSASDAAVGESFESGKVDIAVIPTTLALNLYANNPEGTQVISIATVGGWHVVSGNKKLKKFEDLAGSTLLMSVPNTIGDYVVRYLLDAKGLTDQVPLQFMGGSSDEVAALSTDHAAVGMIVEPYVTAARFRDKKLRSRIDLSNVWSEEVGQDAQIVSAVALVRTTFAMDHPEAVAEFLEAQAASVAAYRDDPDTVAQLVADAGFVDSFEIASAVLPSCGMTCLTGNEMRETMTVFLQTLNDYNPEWVCRGQGLPADDFYYGTEPVEDEASEEDATTEAAE